MSIQNEVPDSLLEKIQKLMRLKDNKAASQGEIENASSMITALLLKYNLSMSQVESHGEKMDPKIQDNLVNLNGKQTRHEASWLNTLFAVIAKFNMCKTLNRAGRNGKDDMGSVIVIGSAMNIEIVIYVVNDLADKIRSMASAAWSGYEGIEKRNTFRRGYLRGCVAGIFTRLDDDEQQRMEESKLSLEGQQMGLMVMNNNQALGNYIGEKFLVRSATKSKSLSGVSGYNQGFAAGQGMNINNNHGQRRLN